MRVCTDKVCSCEKNFSRLRDRYDDSGDLRFPQSTQEIIEPSSTHTTSEKYLSATIIFPHSAFSPKTDKSLQQSLPSVLSVIVVANCAKLEGYPRATNKTSVM